MIYVIPKDISLIQQTLLEQQLSKINNRRATNVSDYTSAKQTQLVLLKKIFKFNLNHNLMSSANNSWTN